MTKRVVDIRARREAAAAARRARYARDIDRWVGGYLLWMHSLELEHRDLAEFHRRAQRRGLWMRANIADLRDVLTRAVDRLLAAQSCSTSTAARHRDSQQLELDLIELPSPATSVDDERRCR